MATQQKDVIWIPSPTGVQGQMLDDIVYGYPGAGTWTDNLNTNNRHISDSGAYNYFLYSVRFQPPGTVVDIGE